MSEINIIYSEPEDYFPKEFREMLLKKKEEEQPQMDTNIAENKKDNSEKED